MVKPPVSLAVIHLRRLGPNDHEVTFNKASPFGLTLRLSGIVGIGWDNNRPNNWLIDCGLGVSKVVQNLVPIPEFRAWVADLIRFRETYPWKLYSPEEWKEQVATEEAARRVKLWGWKDGKHEVPNIKDGSAVCHSVPMTIQKDPKLAEPVTPSKKPKPKMINTSAIRVPKKGGGK